LQQKEGEAIQNRGKAKLNRSGVLWGMVVVMQQVTTILSPILSAPLPNSNDSNLPQGTAIRTTHVNPDAVGATPRRLFF